MRIFYTHVLIFNVVHERVVCDFRCTARSLAPATSVCNANEDTMLIDFNTESIAIRIAVADWQTFLVFA